jgi:hypothetical protein
MAFILNEESALKSLLSGITVEDAGNPARPVGVFYGQPDPQIRQQSYPYITIDLTGVREAFDRAHRGTISLSYTPEGADPEIPFETQYPIPVALSYVITTYSRQPRHDRQLIDTLLSSDRLPFRFGTLSIPEDNTIRRLDVLGFVKRDGTEQDKRLFRNVFSIEISAELLPTTLHQLYKVLYPPTITTNTSNTPFETLHI